MRKGSSSMILVLVALVAIVGVMVSITDHSPTGMPTRGGIKVTIRGCISGTADCDGNPFTVCESNLNTDTSNCGACGNVCGAGEGCSNGVCLPGGPISCTLRAGACSGGETFVWSVSDLVEGHVSLANTFPNSNCCTTTAGTLSATCGTTVLRGSGAADAHVQSVLGLPVFSPNANYCMSSTAGTVNCRVVGACAANEGCVGSISDVNDGHFGPCGTFANKVCCKVN